ncbi:MAG: DUF1653 domain-containing protein [bacterium]
MNQSNEAIMSIANEVHPMKFTTGEICKTSEGNEYKIKSVARDSANPSEFFVVYEQLHTTEENNRKQSLVKNLSSFKSLEDFDKIDTEPTNQASQAESSMNANVENSENNNAISIGQRYVHFKSGDVYIIKDVAKNPSNKTEEFVIYEGQYNSPEFGDHPVWLRKLEDFTGLKTFNGDEKDEEGNIKKPVKRFTLINEPEIEHKDDKKAALDMIGFLWQQMGIMGANDRENPIVNETIRRLRANEIEPKEAVGIVQELLDNKQNYH